ncbi:hypothetical protein C8P68_1017 [Mucilaginibacter yixingensis]|uniref:Uncharacterized protein n=1 Tax=Mucilaginibacter yixingensis TaxID=1295612 RepID=A0A2T5JEC5_9SPHI|nr:hypothetical protein C8P68_1017 [Mucilaginibacter yixingensis]
MMDEDSVNIYSVESRYRISADNKKANLLLILHRTAYKSYKLQTHYNQP